MSCLRHSTIISYRTFLQFIPRPTNPGVKADTRLFSKLNSCEYGESYMLVEPCTSICKLPWRKAVISRARLHLSLFQQSLSARMFTICQAHRQTQNNTRHTLLLFATSGARAREPLHLHTANRPGQDPTHHLSSPQCLRSRPRELT